MMIVMVQMVRNVRPQFHDFLNLGEGAKIVKRYRPVHGRLAFIKKGLRGVSRQPSNPQMPRRGSLLALNHFGAGAQVLHGRGHLLAQRSALLGALHCSLSCHIRSPLSRKIGRCATLFLPPRTQLCADPKNHVRMQILTSALPGYAPVAALSSRASWPSGTSLPLLESFWLPSLFPSSFISVEVDALSSAIPPAKGMDCG